MRRISPNERNYILYEHGRRESRAAECSEDEAVFDEAVKKIAKAKPKDGKSSDAGDK